MNINELKDRFTKGELSKQLGNSELKRIEFSPLFSNLYENKVVYHERFTCIVKSMFNPLRGCWQVCVVYPRFRELHRGLFRLAPCGGRYQSTTSATLSDPLRLEEATSGVSLRLRSVNLNKPPEGLVDNKKN
jgi:hypothetical protein